MEFGISYLSLPYLVVLVGFYLVQLFNGNKNFKIFCNVISVMLFTFDTFVMQGLELIPLGVETVLLINNKKIVK